MTTSEAVLSYQTDVIVVGAGPAGLFSVFELGVNDMKAHVIDIQEKAGGQCVELYPEKPIYDIPGVPCCTGAELIDRLRTQIMPFDPVFHFGQMAESLEKTDDGRWRVATDAGVVIEAPVVILAAGGGSFVPKKPPLPDIESYEGISLFYLVRQREKFRGKKVVIAGGGDSALDWVINLHDVASHVTLVHRRNDFRAAPDSVSKMRALVEAGKVSLKIANITSLQGHDGQISHVVLQEDGADEPLVLSADCMLAFYGLTMKLGPVSNFGVAFEGDRIAVNPLTFETNLAGVFSIGDICTYDGKVKRILSGFQEAAVAAKNAFAYVHPDRKYKFQYSSSSGNVKAKLGKVA